VHQILKAYAQQSKQQSEETVYRMEENPYQPFFSTVD
jgi:hypothetical protein